MIESNLGQHLSLAVAAHLARSQLVKDPLAPSYDSQHLSETLCVIGQALAKVTPLYVQEAPRQDPRELAFDELDGATVAHSATTVQLKDGRRLSSVSVKRADLRNAVAILKATGIEGFVPPPAAAVPAPSRKVTPEEQLARLDEMERLMFGRLGDEETERMRTLAVSIARDASRGSAANLAMRLMTAINASQRSGLLEDDARFALTQLRWSLEAQESPAAPATA